MLLDPIQMKDIRYNAPRQMTNPFPGPRATQDQTQPPDPLRQNYGSDLRIIQHDMQRNSLSSQYNSEYSNHLYQDEPNNSHQIQTATYAHYLEPQYSTYLQSGEQTTHFQRPQQPSPHLSFPPGFMLPPPAQHASPWETNPDISARQQSGITSVNQLYSFPQFMSVPAQHNSYAELPSIGYSVSQAPQSVYSIAPVATPELAQASVSLNSQPQQETDGRQTVTLTDIPHIEQHIREVFDLIIAGRVNAASDLLMKVSQILLTSAVGLGLHLDDESQHQYRFSLWREFNHCWEALAQKQKKISEDDKRNKNNTEDKLDAGTINAMLDRLVTLCDRLEVYGLVDYEMGVWEEQIISAFMVCLDLFERSDGSSAKSHST